MNPNIRNKKLNPLVKWPGGKRTLLSKLSPIIGEVTGRYFEPFLGGAAVFLSVEPRRSHLSDCNKDLINFYTQARDQPESLISRLQDLRNSEEDYYKIRRTHETEPVRSAARFLYLTSLSFNGIYRINREGMFNVPYGHKVGKAHFDAEQIRLLSKTLARARISCCDFESAVKKAKFNDTVYFDPPYTVAHGNNGFLKYNEKIFSWEDQQRLASVALELANRGCRVFISNAFHPEVKRLYPDFIPHEVTRQSLIAASSKFRGTISEYVFSSC